MRRPAILLALAATLLAVRPAAASCAGPEPGMTKQRQFESDFRDARVVFIGTVLRFLQNDSRFAVVRVDETRKGPALPKEVEVHGTPMAPNDPNSPMQSASSVDRTYQLDGRYLFMFDEEGPPFKDSSCGPTRDLARGFPGERVFESGPDVVPEKTSASIPWAAAGAGAGAILAALVGLALADRRRHSQA